MALPERRMDLSVIIAERVLRNEPEAPLDRRLTAFRMAFAALAALDAGDEDWTEDTLDAAWNLVAPAFARGGDLEEAVAAVAAAHQTIIDVVGRVPRRSSQPSRLRRNG